MSDAASFVTKYPSELLLVIVLVAIIIAFMTETIVPGTRFKKQLEAMDAKIDRLIEILLFKGSDD